MASRWDNIGYEEDRSLEEQMEDAKEEFEKTSVRVNLEIRELKAEVDTAYKRWREAETRYLADANKAAKKGE